MILEQERLYERIRRGDSVSKQEALACLPDRGYTAQVYRFVRDHTFYEEDIDLLCYRLGSDGRDAARALLTIDILKELGVFVADDSGRLTVDASRKVQLESSELLRQVQRLTLI